jgi:hypothetical protein
MQSSCNRSIVKADTTGTLSSARQMLPNLEEKLFAENIPIRTELTHRWRACPLVREGYMKKFVLVVALAMASMDPAFAQAQDVQTACTPDVMRLCQQDIPDHDRIIACLVRSTLQLSPACSVVFNRGRTAAVASGKSQSRVPAHITKKEGPKRFHQHAAAR